MCFSTGTDAWFLGYGLVFIRLIFVLGNFGSTFWIGALIEGLKGYQFRVFTNFCYRHLERNFSSSRVVATAIVSSTRSFGVKGIADTGYSNAIAVTVYQFTFDDVVLSALKILKGYLVDKGYGVGIGFTGGIDYLGSIAAFQSGADARLRSHRAGRGEFERAGGRTGNGYCIFAEVHLGLELNVFPCSLGVLEDISPSDLNTAFEGRIDISFLDSSGASGSVIKFNAH